MTKIQATGFVKGRSAIAAACTRKTLYVAVVGCDKFVKVTRKNLMDTVKSMRSPRMETFWTNEAEHCLYIMAVSEI